VSLLIYFAIGSFVIAIKNIFAKEIITWAMRRNKSPEWMVQATIIADRGSHLPPEANFWRVVRDIINWPIMAYSLWHLSLLMAFTSTPEPVDITKEIPKGDLDNLVQDAKNKMREDLSALADEHVEKIESSGTYFTKEARARFQNVLTERYSKIAHDAIDKAVSNGELKSGLALVDISISGDVTKQALDEFKSGMSHE
jgi:hypothetical protein